MAFEVNAPLDAAIKALRHFDQLYYQVFATWSARFWLLMSHEIFLMSLPSAIADAKHDFFSAFKNIVSLQWALKPAYVLYMQPIARKFNARRPWVDISQSELAEAATVSLSTVRDYEKGRRVPIGNNLTAMRSALEAWGITLTENGISGRPK